MDKKLGTIYFKRKNNKWCISGEKVYDIYSTTGISPYKILKIFKEQFKKEHKLQIKALDEFIEELKTK